MRIFVTGLRGFPDIPGGIETHCASIYPLIAKKGASVRVARRRQYVTSSTAVPGIEFVDIWSPKTSSLETIVHTFLSVFHAFFWRADILHIHAIGPGIFVPMAKLLGLKVVFTHHGPDYERQKWGKAAKWVLRLGEQLACRWSNQCIAISKPIQALIKENTQAEAALILNGTPPARRTESTEFIGSYGLTPQSYFLCVARFVPEKGLHDLVTAFTQTNSAGYLVIAGDDNYETTYSKDIKSLAKKNLNIIITGYVTGSPLTELFSHAKGFILPSYHEGLPIALLEAMSFGLDPLVSDIEAHKQVPLHKSCFFKLGDISDLAKKIEMKSSTQKPDMNEVQLKELVSKYYNWDIIAKQTYVLFQRTARIVHAMKKHSSIDGE